MAYYDTEELWFPEWEHGGMPWEKPEGYTKHNPIELREELEDADARHPRRPRLPRGRTPRAWRTFTALQRKGIPSRFLHFPDENHWVLKPQNRKRWHEEVLAWIAKWAKK